MTGKRRTQQRVGGDAIPELDTFAEIAKHKEMD